MIPIDLLFIDHPVVCEVQVVVRKHLPMTAQQIFMSVFKRKLICKNGESGTRFCRK